MGNKQSKYENVFASNYYPKGGYVITKHLEPIARVLLIAVYDDDHPLSQFRGMRYIIKAIWQYAIQFNKHFYSPYIEIVDYPLSNHVAPYTYFNFNQTIAFKHIYEPLRTPCNNYHGDSTVFDSLQFPQPLKKEININMMPIKIDISNMTIKYKQQLSDELYGYIPWIIACIQADPTQIGKICYLTIHESFVEKGKTQRRPGLHIELPGNGGGDERQQYRGWGGGELQKDGIFIASNIDDSCAVWNCRIIQRKDKKKKVDVMDDMGGLEHLRHALPKDRQTVLEGGKLYWITDRTPHDVLPMKESGWRQFFRFVSSKLSVWYEQHSTPNPMGIVPDKKITKIIKGNKFKQK